ncbi:MAG: hypothetical protein LBS16_05380 [Prevotellaceae bacterium]|jgi:hypothetical protein|nr:hypothetical protein [Prevotellaceae bacterium]
MKSITKIFATVSLILVGALAFYACNNSPVNRIIDPNESNIPELIITEYDGGNAEWVSVQKGTSADGKIADAKQDRNDIRQSNDTLYIQLLRVDNDTVPFTETGSYTVVLKHDQRDKMFIKLGVKFTDGLAGLKWGSWMAWAPQNK